MATGSDVSEVLEETDLHELADMIEIVIEESLNDVKDRGKLTSLLALKQLD